MEETSSNNNTTPVASSSSVELSVTPNPACTGITLDGLSERTAVRIYTLDGVLVRAVEVAPQGRIDIRSLKAGVYVLRANGRSLRFVKK